jgi:hypothetical protein
VQPPLLSRAVPLFVGWWTVGAVTWVGAAPFGSTGFVSDGPVPGFLVPFWWGLSFPLGWPDGRVPGFCRKPVLAVSGGGGGGAVVTSQLL